MTDTTPLPWSQPRRVAELAGRKPTRFDLTPDAPTRAAIADWAGITALESLRLKGQLVPRGRSDWDLEAELTARVVQPCVVTLAPVTTDLRDSVLRRYLADMPEPTGDEIEMPEDDSAEALPAVIDLAAVALEALELALPLYPRAPGAELGEISAAAPGAAPLTPESTRPFAGLADLLKTGQKAPEDGAD
ncbi:YceD family protein [Phaeovulum sp. NW3]|uniref:YceD family protein n=1 Tax=Phaeovulum sp. NW3 TaxID=2934933 RepID=UPI0020203292|nr:YceD family protein [Phaeovulum sp. NW3]MCL7465408.1 YceD family protein [Phaeovulum sp. NW3]